MTTGEKIKQLRKQLGMTQEELGNLIGVQKAAINKYETGVVVNLKQSTIAALAHALHVSPIDLLSPEDLPCDPPPEFPHTVEARSLAKGIDRMPKEQREAILNMMMGLYPGLFEKGIDSDDT